MYITMSGNRPECLAVPPVLLLRIESYKGLELKRSNEIESNRISPPVGFVNLWGRSFKLQLGSADAKRDAQMLGAVLGAAKGGGPRGRPMRLRGVCMRRRSPLAWRSCTGRRVSRASRRTDGGCELACSNGPLVE